MLKYIKNFIILSYFFLVTISAFGKSTVFNYADCVELSHWNSFPISIYFENNIGLQNITLNGFEEWGKTINGDNLYTVNLNNTKKADIVVTYIKLSNPPISDIGDTCLYLDNNYNCYKAHIYLYIWPNLSLEKIKSTAAHEFGHALGIIGHSPDKNDIMYFMDNPLSIKVTNKDLNTLKIAYKNMGLLKND